MGLDNLPHQTGTCAVKPAIVLKQSTKGSIFVSAFPGKDATAQNLFYNSVGQIVYFVAGVGIVYSRKPSHTQHYFLGHTDDIKSLALCPAPIDVAGKQYPAKTIVATAQVECPEGC